MNYTKLVREYCKNNSGAIFDVSKLKNTEFADVPYKTLLKILSPDDMSADLTLMKAYGINAVRTSHSHLLQSAVRI